MNQLVQKGQPMHRDRTVRLLTLAKMAQTLRYNSSQAESGAALYLIEEERKVVFNKVESGALAERFMVRAKRENPDVNDQPER